MEKPIVHAFFVCYNEETILPHLLKHYSQFCEKITILDNGSTDKSVKIINSFPNTEVINFNSNGEFNDWVNMQLKNNIWKKSKGKCDFVIIGDSDEFLYHENIIDFLVKHKNNGYTLFKPEGYHMIGDENLELKTDDNITEKIKYGIRTPVLDKMMIFDCNQIDEINYSFGCHHCNPTGNVKIFNGTELKMLHFKFLGIKNYIYRNKMRRERLSQFNKKNNLGTYYLYSDKENIEDYKNHLIKRVKVL